MIAGMSLFILAAVIIVIWVLIEVKRMKHKLFAIFLIGLIIFSYVSMSVVFSDSEINVKTIPGAISAGKIYFSWLGSLFGNMKSITSHAISLDWVNSTEE